MLVDNTDTIFLVPILIKQSLSMEHLVTIATKLMCEQSTGDNVLLMSLPGIKSDVSAKAITMVGKISHNNC